MLAVKFKGPERLVSCSSCRCQLTCDELKKQKQDFVCLCRALQQETQDVTEYLQHSVAARDQEAEELLEELEKLQQAAERDTEALKLLHTEQLQEAQEQVDELKTVMVGQGETVRGQTLRMKRHDALKHT